MCSSSFRATRRPWIRYHSISPHQNAEFKFPALLSFFKSVDFGLRKGVETKNTTYCQIVFLEKVFFEITAVISPAASSQRGLLFRKTEQEKSLCDQGWRLYITSRLIDLVARGVFFASHFPISCPPVRLFVWSGGPPLVSVGSFPPKISRWRGVVRKKSGL